MQIIAHRRNSLEDLRNTPVQYGIEMDIRSFGTELVVHHEPYTNATPFSEWLQDFKHKTLILNVKEEGLETRVLELVHKHGIEDYFFLDQSFPFLVKTARSGERRCAVRVSEFESIQTALAISHLIDWVWVDCFTKFPLTGNEAATLQKAGLKLCLVSPELEGHDPEKGIPELRSLLQRENIQADAVCTKRPDLWEK